MAIAVAKQVQIEKGEDHIVAIERNIVINEETGRAAEVKKTVVLVDLGDGKVGQAVATEVTAVNLGAPAARGAQRSPARSLPPPRPQPTPAPTPAPPPAYTVVVQAAVCCLVIMFILLALPIAMIVMGALYINNCDGQPFIPLWALVYGCVATAQLSVSVIKWCFCRKPKDDDDDDSDTKKNARKLISLIETLSILFLLAWAIVGGYWVFRINYTIISPCPGTHNDCCDSVLVWFSIGSLAAIYLFILFACCCCCAVVWTAFSS